MKDGLAALCRFPASLPTASVRYNEREAVSGRGRGRFMAAAWERVTVAGKPADAFAPNRPARFGVLFLHDLDRRTLVGEPAFARCLQEWNLGCVCPHGEHGWWGDRLCG